MLEIAALRRVQELHDLPGVMAAIGYEPLWHELPDAVLIARCGDFLWVGIESSTGKPSREGILTARRMARGGRVAGVACFDRATHSLELSVDLHGDAAYRFQLDELSPEDLSRLERLRPQEGASALATAARVAEGLATEAVGHRFFRAFRETLDRHSGSLSQTLSAADRHSLALIQLTRVLVLYFVQAKGWLDDRDRFLREEVDRCLASGGSIHRHLLKPLFFGTLNRPRELRSRRVARWGRIPFLNGGLFSVHPLEQRYQIEIPTTEWVRAFDHLFEKFHFVIDTAAGPGIAPDMLGRVFEGVMDPDARLNTGSFYTPRSLVSEVLKSGLTAFLARRLRVGDAVAERLLEDPSPAARVALESITILDPAVGSGAFLLGALDILTAPWSHNRVASYQRKRMVVTRNLFGVDQNANAVRLAELRLWLEVIAADPAVHPDQVTPLPNLDGLLRAGDSLADPTGLGVTGAPGSAALLGKVRGQLARATGSEKRGLLRTLKVLERETMVKTIESALANSIRKARELERESREPTLFGVSNGFTTVTKRHLEELQREQLRYRELLNSTRRDEVLPWFHYQSHFADVFVSRGGFDLVVGNPPWIRMERIASERRRALAARYRWWRRGGSNAKGYPRSPDLSIAFLERALELTAPGGTVAMLVPAKIATADYAAPARAAITGQTQLHVAADLSHDKVGVFDATTYPMALVMSRAQPPTTQVVRNDLKVGSGSAILQNSLSGAPWILAAPQLRAALADARGEHPTIGQQFHCRLGVKTGCNRAFLDPDPGIEESLIRWAVRGRNVTAFKVDPRHRLLWTHDSMGQPMPDLPPGAKRWIELHRAALAARKDYDGGPIWTVFRTAAMLSPHRVVWSDLARRLEAAALSGTASDRLVPLNSCYVIVTRSQEEAWALTAWLNSSWIRSLAWHGADPASGGFARFNARVVSELPLPAGVLSDRRLMQLTQDAAQCRHPAQVQEDLDDIAAAYLELRPAQRTCLVRSLERRSRSSG